MGKGWYCDLYYYFQIQEIGSQLARRGRPAKRQTTESLNGQIALAPAADEHLESPSSITRPACRGELFQAIARRS